MHTTHRWHELRSVAAEQHGLVTRAQALAAGFSSSACAAAVARGEWRRMAPGIYALPGARDDALARIESAVLGSPAAAAAGWTSAWLWNLVPAAPSTTEVVVPTGRRGPTAPRVRARRSRTLTGADVAEVRGVRTLTVARTIVDLAAHAQVELLRQLAVDARQRGLLEVAELAAAVARAGPAAGSGRVRRLVADLAEESSDSMLEHRARRRLQAAGFVPHPQPWPVKVNGMRVVLDIAFPEYRVAIEVDGFAYHSTPRQLVRDHERHNLLLATDWKVLRIGWVDVERRFDAVVAQLRELLTARGWQPGS